MEMLEQNMAVVPMALAMTAAAMWTTVRWLQIVAAIIVLACWVVYFSTLQGAVR